jgi:hypothetical protein
VVRVLFVGVTLLALLGWASLHWRWRNIAAGGALILLRLGPASGCSFTSRRRTAASAATWASRCRTRQGRDVPGPLANLRPAGVVHVVVRAAAEAEVISVRGTFRFRDLCIASRSSIRR